MRAKMARHQIGFFPENGNKGIQNTRSVAGIAVGQTAGKVERITWGYLLIPILYYGGARL